MTASGWVQIAIFCALVSALVVPLGAFMARAFDGGRTFLDPVLRPIERASYAIAGVNGRQEQPWAAYALSLLAFNLVGLLVVYGLQRLQAVLPLNPQGLPAVDPDLAFNTAVSFATNTNWQSYAGESTLAYLPQMLGLTVQNFVSAATGIAVAIAVTRGFARKEAATIGNFWVDMTRATLWLLLPLAVVLSLVLVSQGVPQSFAAYVDLMTLEGGGQSLAQGPAASQIAIKQLGTNGGGFFNANSAHPYENPTAVSNLAQMVSILLISAALTATFGRMVGNAREGWSLFAAMGIMLVAGLASVYAAETTANPLLTALGVEDTGGNMEGKEVRFGLANSAAWAVATTAASNGSVNAMHDSFMPLGGMIPLINIMLGEIIFGGVGAGLYGILLFVIVAMFVAGLMVGRTPEYLGKKIEAKEVKLALIAILTIPLGILGGVGLALAFGAGGFQDSGPHGLTELLYAYTSATGNNGSAFAGFTADVPYHNTMLGFAMLLGRYAVIIPVLAIAGSLAAKKKVAASAGTFPTDTPLFVGLLIGVILIIGGLTFFPVLALGPIVEHLALFADRTF